jgi:hypothetical protein
MREQAEDGRGLGTRTPRRSLQHDREQHGRDEDRFDAETQRRTPAAPQLQLLECRAIVRIAPGEIGCRPETAIAFTASSAC